MNWNEITEQWVEEHKKPLMEYMANLIKIETKDVVSYSIRYHDATFFKIIALNINIAQSGELVRYDEEKTVCILTDNYNIDTKLDYDRSISGFISWFRERKINKIL